MSAFTNQPAIVELFGRAVIAGMITEETHVGAEMLRVDVPELDDYPAFTKFFGGAAVYAITPTDEDTMMEAVNSIRVQPVALYILPNRQLPAPAPEPDVYPDDDDDWYEPDHIP